MKKFKVKMGQLVFLFLFPVILLAQNATYEGDRKFSIKELKTDLSILRHNLENVHPGLYTYTSKEKFNLKFKEIEEQIDHPMSEIEFYRLIGPILADIGDQHTDMEVSEACYEYLDSQSLLFPFEVKWVKDALYITHNLSSVQNISPGEKIISINGKEAGAVFSQLHDYMPRDGFNSTGPDRTLSRLFMDFYYFIIGQPDGFDLVLEQISGETKRVFVPAEKFPRIMEYYRERYPWPELSGKVVKKPMLSFEIQGRNANLTIKSFHLGRIKNGGQNFKKFLKTTFKQIEKSQVENLILDLRNNGGGSDEAVIELFSYLTDQPFIFYKELSTITTTIPNHEYYQGNIARIEKWAVKNLRKEGGVYHLKDEPGTQKQAPKASSYQGNLYVLVNAGSASATGDLSGMLKQYTNSIFIGSEPGGNPVQNTAGNSLSLILPNTRIRTIIPTTLYKINVDLENTGHGILPDYKVEPSIQDILNKRDVVKEFTLELIRREN